MFSRHIYPAHQYAEKELYERTPKDGAIQDVTMAKMTGVLRQLGYLAYYSSHIFDGVFQIASATDERLASAAMKVVNLQKEAPMLEKLAAGGRGPEFFKDIHEPKIDDLEFTARQNLFVKSTRPKHLQAQYEKSCIPPPDFSTLEEYTVDGKRCRPKFSDPEFFVREWLKNEEKRLEMAKKMKNQRKKDKRKKRKKRASVKGLQVSTRERGGSGVGGGVSGEVMDEGMLKRPAEGTRRVSGDQAPDADEAAMHAMGMDDEVDEPAAPVPARRAAPSAPSKPPPRKAAPPRPPAVSDDSYNSVPSPEPSPTPTPHPAAPSAPSSPPKPAGPVCGPGEVFAKDHPLYAKFFKNLAKGILPRPAVERGMTMKQLDVGLLDTPDRIISLDNPPMAQQTAKKKKTKQLTMKEQLEQAKKKLAGGAPKQRSFQKAKRGPTMLEQIQGGGFKLKSVKNRKLKPKKEEKEEAGIGGQSVAEALAARRAAMQSDEDSGSDWGSDDSDGW